MKSRYMTYTKDNGDKSHRQVLVVSKPRENYLAYDVTKLTEDQVNYLQEAMEEISTHSDNVYAEVAQVTGIKINSLWRSFKPGGIDWEE